MFGQGRRELAVDVGRADGQCFVGSCNLIAINKRKKKGSDRNIDQANADSRSDQSHSFDQSHRKDVAEAKCFDLDHLNRDVLDMFFIMYVFGREGVYLDADNSTYIGKAGHNTSRWPMGARTAEQPPRLYRYLNSEVGAKSDLPSRICSIITLQRNIQESCLPIQSESIERKEGMYVRPPVFWRVDYPRIFVASLCM